MSDRETHLTLGALCLAGSVLRRDIEALEIAAS